MLDTRRHWFKSAELLVVKIFGLLPITPNQYTYSSLFFGAVTFWAITRNELILALLFFLVAAGIDFIDGAMARARNMVTTRGAFLDAVFDRYIESSVLLGLIFINLPNILLPSSFWICLAIFGSLLTTYIPAVAQQKNYIITQLRKGIMARAERIIFIVIALLLAIIYPDHVYATYVIIALAIISNISAIQRFFLIEMANKKDS